jgi:hypothetical protein
MSGLLCLVNDLENQKRHDAFGVADIPLYTYKFTQYQNGDGMRNLVKDGMTWRGCCGADAVKAIAVELEVDADVNLTAAYGRKRATSRMKSVTFRMKSVTFRMKQKNGIHFADLEGKLIRASSTLTISVPEDVITTMYDAVHVLPRALIRLIAGYWLSPPRAAFVINRFLLTQSDPERGAGPLTPLPSETTKISWELSSRCNETIVTNITWPRGSHWIVRIDHMIMFESPANPKAEWVLGQFSGGIGQMHVGHARLGHFYDITVTRPTDIAWTPYAECENKSVPDSKDNSDPALIALVNDRFHTSGCDVASDITRISSVPIATHEGVKEYLVFVPAQRRSILGSKSEKIFGYNNSVLVDSYSAALRYAEM